jgi:hypothetical protein
MEGGPQIKRALPTFLEAVVPVPGAYRPVAPVPMPAGRLAVPAGIGFGDGEAEGFEFGDQFAEAAVVVEPGP